MEMRKSEENQEAKCFFAHSSNKNVKTGVARTLYEGREVMS